MSNSPIYFSLPVKSALTKASCGCKFPSVISGGEKMKALAIAVVVATAVFLIGLGIIHNRKSQTSSRELKKLEQAIEAAKQELRERNFSEAEIAYEISGARLELFRKELRAQGDNCEEDQLALSDLFVPALFAFFSAGIVLLAFLCVNTQKNSAKSISL
jgi:hypothetical protein